MKAYPIPLSSSMWFNHNLIISTQLNTAHAGAGHKSCCKFGHFFLCHYKKTIFTYRLQHTDALMQISRLQIPQSMPGENYGVTNLCKLPWDWERLIALYMNNPYTMTNSRNYHNFVTHLRVSWTRYIYVICSFKYKLIYHKC